MDILREEFYSCDDPKTRLTLYYQLDITYYKDVLNITEPNICYNLYSYFYSDMDQKDILVLINNTLCNKLLIDITNKEVISTLNLIPSQQLTTSIF